MEVMAKQKTLTWINAGFLSLLLLSFALTLSSLLGSKRVFASSDAAGGAMLNLLVEAGVGDTRSMESNLWIHYDKKSEFILGGEWKLQLMLVRKENDTVFLSSTLIDLNAEHQVISEPQLLVDLGKEAKVEVGTESGRYALTFTVTEAPIE